MADGSPARDLPSAPRTSTDTFSGRERPEQLHSSKVIENPLVPSHREPSRVAADTSSNSNSGNDIEIERTESERDRQWRLDHSQFAALRIDPEEAAAGASENGRGLLRVRSRRALVSGYYRRQNEMIDGFSEMDQLSASLLHPNSQELAAQERLERHEQYAIHISNIANILLLVAKIIASVTSGSLAIIASTLDSLLDCLSGFILWYTSRSMRRLNPYKYPIGKKRMQPLGIIVFASLMAMLGFQILIEAVRQFMEPTHSAGLGPKWQIYVAILLVAIVVKLALYLYCRLFSNEIVLAYAQDHFFDVVTNVVGLLAAVLAGLWAWWIDPAGAALLAIYTMVNWSKTVLENVRSLTGRSAPPSFLQKLTYLCWNHHEAILKIDTVRAYTFGESYFTEVDVVLPREMPLQTAHDIGEALQNKLERLPEIERAFVHLDYEVSHRPEHHPFSSLDVPAAPAVEIASP